MFKKKIQQLPVKTWGHWPVHFWHSLVWNAIIPRSVCEQFDSVLSVKILVNLLFKFYFYVFAQLQLHTTIHTWHGAHTLIPYIYTDSRTRSRTHPHPHNNSDNKMITNVPCISTSAFLGWKVGGIMYLKRNCPHAKENSTPAHARTHARTHAHTHACVVFLHHLLCKFVIVSDHVL